jgi:hypothetical protein
MIRGLQSNGDLSRPSTWLMTDWTSSSISQRSSLCQTKLISSQRIQVLHFDGNTLRSLNRVPQETDGFVGRIGRLSAFECTGWGLLVWCEWNDPPRLLHGRRSCNAVSRIDMSLLLYSLLNFYIQSRISGNVIRHQPRRACANQTFDVLTLRRSRTRSASNQSAISSSKSPNSKIIIIIINQSEKKMQIFRKQILNWDLYSIKT